MMIVTQGAVVIITGSAQGIGLAVAEHLLAEGAKVALTTLPFPHVTINQRTEQLLYVTMWQSCSPDNGHRRPTQHQATK